jgi:hypothetical protein
MIHITHMYVCIAILSPNYHTYCLHGCTHGRYRLWAWDRKIRIMNHVLQGLHFVSKFTNALLKDQM